MRYNWGARGVAGIVLAGGVALIVVDETDRGLRRFFDQQPFVTSVVSGVLVLLFTVLVVDQVVRHRGQAARSKAVGAHVAIVLAQGIRTADATIAVQSGTGDPQAARDEQRTYMLMLLLAAPVLIESPPARRFLEDAQRLAGTTARILFPSLPTSFLRVLPTDLDGAVQALRASAGPLLAALTTSERTAVEEPEAEVAEAGGVGTAVDPTTGHPAAAGPTRATGGNVG